ncbi:hypothetical protein [Nocardioides jensenii]|uniref:hypothetical protein n=1 Tax=Nocardioides jensenii TaxID=1843 RepID=UPI0012F8F218|nr:hypothetical protein [Nocardioides jensenii]
MSAILGKTEAPLATRTGRSGWRDPRLWIGVALVAVSVLIGARVLGGADNTVEVWAARADLAQGEKVGDGDLVARRVHLGDDELALYLSGDKDLPEQSTLTRSVGAGELVPRAALGKDDGLRRVSLTIPVGTGDLLVEKGAMLDVWVGPPDASNLAEAIKDAGPVLRDIVVIEAPAVDDSFGGVGTREILIGVRDLTDEQLEQVVGALSVGRIFFVDPDGDR